MHVLCRSSERDSVQAMLAEWLPRLREYEAQYREAAPRSTHPDQSTGSRFSADGSQHNSGDAAAAAAVGSSAAGGGGAVATGDQACGDVARSLDEKCAAVQRLFVDAEVKALTKSPVKARMLSTDALRNAQLALAADERRERVEQARDEAPHSTQPRHLHSELAGFNTAECDVASQTRFVMRVCCSKRA